MPRLIDADALIKEIWIIRGSLQMLDNTQGADLIMHGLWMVEEKINEAPTIDAVSVVRCKECKHRTYCYGEVHMTNKRQTVNIHKDIDFCSYGEREGE